MEGRFRFTIIAANAGGGREDPKALVGATVLDGTPSKLGPIGVEPVEEALELGFWRCGHC